MDSDYDEDRESDLPIPEELAGGVGMPVSPASPGLHVVISGDSRLRLSADSTNSGRGVGAIKHAPIVV